MRKDSTGFRVKYARRMFTDDLSSLDPYLPSKSLFDLYTLVSLIFGIS